MLIASRTLLRRTAVMLWVLARASALAVTRTAFEPIGCPPAHHRPLKVRGNSQGLGNRLGWYLTVAALAESLGRRAFTSWFNAKAAGLGHRNDRDYSFAELDRLIRWPYRHVASKPGLLCRR